MTVPTPNPQNPLTWEIQEYDFIIPALGNTNNNWLNDYPDKPNYPTWYSWYTQKQIAEGFSDPSNPSHTLSNLTPGSYPVIPYPEHPEIKQTPFAQ